MEERPEPLLTDHISELHCKLTDDGICIQIAPLGELHDYNQHFLLNAQDALDLATRLMELSINTWHRG